MSREWQPGDVAMVTPLGGAQEQMLRTHRDNWIGASQITWRDRDVRVARLLVVIDLEPHQAEFVADVLEQTRHDWTNKVAAALREVIPPKLAEPTGLGAVVEDAEGNQWLRDGIGSDRIADGHWWNVTTMQRRDGQTTRAHYVDIDVVRVLSEGVTA